MCACASLKKAKEEESRARMEMAVLEGKLHDTATALAALEKARDANILMSMESAKALEADTRWKAINVSQLRTSARHPRLSTDMWHAGYQEQQQQGHAAELQAQIMEQQNRSQAEKEQFEKLLLNKTGAGLLFRLKYCTLWRPWCARRRPS